jgi:Uma2 family endonuclease
MTLAEFLDWEPGDEERYELVDGVPVMMAWSRNRDSHIAVNAIVDLHTMLSGGCCHVFTGNFAVLIPNGNIRRPKVGVECGRHDDDAMYADAPRLVVEVLSPSARRLDMFGKLDEYKTIESLNHIVLVDPDQPRAIHWWRAEDRGWRQQVYEGLEAAIVFLDLQITIGLGELYKGLEFGQFA